MVASKLIISVLTAAGLWLIVSGILKFPPKVSVNAIDKLTGVKKSFSTKYREPVIKFIEPLIHIPVYKRETMCKDLGYAGINETPEHYIANIVLNTLCYMAMSLILLPIYPVLTAVLMALSVLYFFNNFKIKDSDKRKAKIEAELPRFTSYLVQNLPRRQGLIPMIRGYREIAGKEFGQELDILITGLKTKNHEAALIEFEARINSTLVSDIVRGMIGIDNGENMQSYLCNIEVRMNENEIANLKKEAVKRPEKLVPASWLLFFSIMVI